MENAESSSLGSVLTAVAEERKRQDTQWGGPDHDDRHTGQEWAGLITKQLGSALGYWMIYEDCMLKAAALAVAAVQHARRKRGI
jgi:hypothetical protein